ncbi:MAG: alpha/beta fold hydrolase, partial [Polyangiales bacterium]
LELRGTRVRYLDGGARDAPAVLFLHGAGRDHTQWTELAHALAETRRVIVPDLPGFGASGLVDGRSLTSWEALAEVAIDLVACLELGRVAVIGQGTGAAVALVAAADRPEFVERLVLSAPPVYRAAQPFAERLLDLPVLGPTIVRRVVGSSVLRRHVGPFAVGSSATWALLEGARRPATIEARLPRVRAGALVLWGREDGILPWTHGTRLARELSGARLEILDCGHFPAEERPQQVESLVRAFLDEGPHGRHKAAVR